MWRKNSPPQTTATASGSRKGQESTRAPASPSTLVASMPATTAAPSSAMPGRSMLRRERSSARSGGISHRPSSAIATPIGTLTKNTPRQLA